MLVERIRKEPYTVLLLDEIEKAHPDLFSILLQVMDHATLTDNQGREADFRHVTLIMTSNVGAREMAARGIGFGSGRASDGRKEIERLFSPEFRNRLDEVVTFSELGPDVMGKVVDKFVKEVEGQLAERKVKIELGADARAWLAKKGYDPDFGARRWRARSRSSSRTGSSTTSCSALSRAAVSCASTSIPHPTSFDSERRTGRLSFRV
jgi:ATP-dependent Clp protease ATP-binding subunit ClpA